MSLRCLSLILNIISIVLLLGLALCVSTLYEKVRINEYRIIELEQDLELLKEEL